MSKNSKVATRQISHEDATPPYVMDDRLTPEQREEERRRGEEAAKAYNERNTLLNELMLGIDHRFNELLEQLARGTVPAAVVTTAAASTVAVATPGKFRRAINAIGRGAMAVGRGIKAATFAVGRGIKAATFTIGRGLAVAGRVTWSGLKAVGRGVRDAAQVTATFAVDAGRAVGRGLVVVGRAMWRGLSAAAKATNRALVAIDTAILAVLATVVMGALNLIGGFCGYIAATTARICAWIVASDAGATNAVA
jgi:hypothetical protein